VGQTGQQMPVTTNSDLALEFYKTGQLAFDRINFKIAFQNYEKAVDEDPDFFMAYFWMYFLSGSCAKEVAELALQTDSDLNEAERQIKSAFKYLLDGEEDKVVEHLNMAIDLYPGDPEVHKILYIIQYQYLKDYEGSIESITRAIEADPDYPLAYNQLGYALMGLERFDEAREAFDTYIELAPDLANPYDSKGDYHMHMEQYGLAYDSYMKAFEIDSSFIISKKKAQKALKLKQQAGLESI
jgi:tetratricopeptide (TPR) repeat protein